jgi:hypothetical protein
VQSRHHSPDRGVHDFADVLAGQAFNVGVVHRHSIPRGQSPQCRDDFGVGQGSESLVLDRPQATADALAHAGAHVVLAVRNPAKGRALAKGIARDTEVRELDLGSLSSVRAFASSWQEPIDVLINNAGIMQVPEARTAD